MTSATELSSLLPSVDPVFLQVSNQWLQKRSRFQVKTSRKAWQISWCSSVNNEFLQLGLEFSIGERRVLLAFENYAVLDSLVVAEPFSFLPELVRGMIVKKMLAEYISLLPKSIAQSIQLLAIHWTRATLPAWQHTLGMNLSQGDVAYQGVLMTDSPATLQWLHEQLPLPINQERLPNYTYESFLIALGTTPLDSDSIAELAIGDLVWIESSRKTGHGIHVHLSNPNVSHVVWQGRVKDNLLTLSTQVMRQAVRVHTKQDVAPEHAFLLTPQLEIGAADMSVDAQAIELPVQFDLGELSVLLSDLQNLQPGFTFELPAMVETTPVNLRVHDKLIAQGELVSVGRKLGVRVTKIV